MLRRRRSWLLVWALSCADASSPEPVTGNHVEAFRSSVGDVESAATTYRMGMQSAGLTSSEGCARLHAAYEANVRPWLVYMAGHVERLDAFVELHAGAATSDLTCVVDEMTKEIDRHHSIACQLVDLALDRAEAEQHVESVISYTDHLSRRCDEMMFVFGVGMDLGWSPACNGGELATE